jgi:glycosyltransferase involved in cell wall biosynthesis
MSEHEGFCVPIVESFHFDVPVLAYAAGAVPETMGGAGILFTGKDYPLLAEFVDRLGRDTVLKERILTAQRERLADFDDAAFARSLRGALGGMLGLGPEAEEAGAAVGEGVGG